MAEVECNIQQIGKQVRFKFQSEQEAKAWLADLMKGNCHLNVEKVKAKEGMK